MSTHLIKVRHSNLVGFRLELQADANEGTLIERSILRADTLVKGTGRPGESTVHVVASYIAYGVVVELKEYCGTMTADDDQEEHPAARGAFASHALLRVLADELGLRLRRGILKL